MPRVLILVFALALWPAGPAVSQQGPPNDEATVRAARAVLPEYIAGRNLPAGLHLDEWGRAVGTGAKATIKNVLRPGGNGDEISWWLKQPEFRSRVMSYLATHRSEHPVNGEPLPFHMRSSAVSVGATLPARFTGPHGVAPPLALGSVPKGTQAFAVILLGPKATDLEVPWDRELHWAAWNLAGDTLSIAAEDLTAADIRHGGEGKPTSYHGPTGSTPAHWTYVVLALDAPLSLPTGAPADAVRTAISRRKVLGRAELTVLARER